MGWKDKYAPGEEGVTSGLESGWKRYVADPLTAGKAIGTAGRKAAVRGGIDAVGGTLRFLASAMSTPKAALIKAVSGNRTPVEFSPTASLDQFNELGDRLDVDRTRMAHPWAGPVLNPAVADLVTDIPMASAMNVVGAKALVPAGRAVANLEAGAFRTRAVPGVKQGLEFFKPGASLPNRYRDAFYKIRHEAEGAADWRAYLREKALKEGLDLPREAQDAITDAIETGRVASLPDGLQKVAMAVERENRNMVADRLRRQMGRGELESDLGYVARIQTPEMKAARGEKPYGRPGLSTMTGRPRTPEGRELTAAEMTAGGARFQPGVTGTMLKGAQNDRDVMHAQIIRALDKQFGRPAMPGEADFAIGKMPGVDKGFNAGMKARLGGRVLPPELRGVVNEMNRAFEPEQWGKTTEFVRNMNDQFRKWALFSPGFVSRNLQNNLVQNTIFGLRNPKYYAQAKDALQKGEPATMKELVSNGVIGKGWSLESGAGKFDVPGVKHLQNKLRNVNQSGEDFFRTAFYLYQRDRGLSPYEAAQRVNQVLFNYSPTFQSRGFKWARRNAIPFINWQANAPQLFVRSSLERPGSMAMAGRIQATLDSENATDGALKNLPEYLKMKGATAVGDSTYLEPQMLGQYDVNNWTGALGEDIQKVKKALGGKATMGSSLMDQVATSSYPQYSLLQAVRTGRDPYTGYPIRDWPKFLAGKVPHTKFVTLPYEVATKKPGWENKLLSWSAGIKLSNKPTQ